MKLWTMNVVKTSWTFVWVSLKIDRSTFWIVRNLKKCTLTNFFNFSKFKFCILPFWNFVIKQSKIVNIETSWQNRSILILHLIEILIWILHSSYFEILRNSKFEVWVCSTNQMTSISRSTDTTTTSNAKPKQKTNTNWTIWSHMWY